MTIQDNQELLLIKRKLSRRSPSNASASSPLQMSPSNSMSQSSPQLTNGEKVSIKSHSNEKRLYHMGGSSGDPNMERMAQQEDYERRVDELSALRDRPPTRNELTNTNYSLDPDEAPVEKTRVESARNKAVREKTAVGTKAVKPDDNDEEERRRLEEEKVRKEEEKKRKEEEKKRKEEEKRRKEEEKKRKEEEKEKRRREKEEAARKKKEEEDEEKMRAESEDEKEEEDEEEVDDDDDEAVVVDNSKKEKEEKSKKGKKKKIIQI